MSLLSTYLHTFLIALGFAAGVLVPVFAFTEERSVYLAVAHPQDFVMYHTVPFPGKQTKFATVALHPTKIVIAKIAEKIYTQLQEA